ncbi:MAG: hypothetical protein HY290_28925 [Planctomycetia bacterium]|nr:hypothetical protein [Planctomycetia bacterium]
MARQLVTGVLDIQLQQLEENGLKHLPLYRDIALMRKNIGALVEKEMEQAVELLVKAQHGTEAERDESFRKARQMIRQIVTRLATERQNLLRRLKSAEIAAQVQRLIDMQSKVWQTTRTIPQQVPSKQEALALAAIEDQGDVKQLFLQLVETLADVSEWGGPLGTGAAEGLQILQAAGVGKELDAAGTHLGALSYADAATSQVRVIKGLRLLLERLNEAHNQIGNDKHGSVALARELIARQEKLREQTKEADLTQPEAERLVEAQATIRKDLNQLSQALGAAPAAEALLEQARSAAYEATGRLFDARQDEALAEQQKVVANLTGLAEQLASAADVAHSDKSSAEAAKQVRDLEQARADIERIRQEQMQVDRTAMENAGGAAPQEQQVSQNLSKVDDNRSLPKAVVTRLASAEQATAAAAKALARGPNAAPDAMQRETLEQADRAVERAASEIAAALDDARRTAKGVEIGELARAAETLERAAAAERDMARAAKSAADKSGLEASAAKAMSQRQADVEGLARAVAQAVEPIAGEAAQSANAAAQDAAASRAQLDQAAAKPGTDSKPAAQSAAQAAAGAAEKLSQAAAKLRRQIDTAAQGLVAESSRQLERVSPVREAVDQALAKAESPLSERMQRLAAAEKAVRKAQVAQQRAAGQAAAADAMQLADALRDAQAEQAKADQAARQLAAGRRASPLETITREHAVAEQAGKLAESAAKRPQSQAARDAGKPDALSESLRDAARAATRAARAALDGDQTQAQAGRDQARQALDRAAHLASTEADEAAAAPAGKPDATAQKKVGEAIADAAKLAQPDAPPAGEILADAGKSSGQAQREAEAGDAPKARAAQEQTKKSLKSAADELKAAREKMSQEQAKQLAEQARQAEQLAAQAVPADPSAVAALRDAQSRAKQGAAESAEQALRAAEAQNQAGKDMQRAAANLSAREQRIERDKAIAEAVRDLARDQAQAAEDIAARSRDLLAENSADGDTGENDPGAGQAGDDPAAGAPAKGGKPSRRRQAAERLSQAQRDFARAQRGTGEAAEEIAGQSNVGNRPLRDAMSRASKMTPRNSGKGQPASPNSAQPDAAGQAGSASQSGLPDDSDDLGTGFIPNSPEATAELMAGEEAAARAAAELGRGHLAQSDGRDSPRDASGANEDSASGNPEQTASNQQGERGGKKKSSRASSGGNSPKSDRDDQSPENQDLKRGPPRTDAVAAAAPTESGKPTTPNRDVDFANRGVGRESWFAKLPPDLRKAIRAKAQRPPPRSYEDKLQKYFESID